MERVEIGGAVMYCGDCREALPDITADVAVSDPVYGIGAGTKVGNSLRKRKKAKGGYETELFEDTPDYVAAVVVPALTACIERFRRVAITPGLRCMWMYPKPDHVGSFQYPGSTVMSCWGPMLWQPVLYYGKDPHHGRLVPDSFPNCNDVDVDTPHPCPKPLKQWMKLVSRASRIGEAVCDPFMGSGTTGVACARLGRKFVGAEIEPRYFDIACRRIEEAYKQADLFVPAPTAKPVQQALFGGEAA